MNLFLICTILLVTTVSLPVVIAQPSPNPIIPDVICLTGSAPFPIADSCDPGYYCPLYNASDPATYPTQCAPTNDCMLRRLTTRYCEPQGRFEPMLCSPGFYCPTPLVQLQCPEGHFCPIGTFEPIKCGALTSCAAGAFKKFEYSSVVCILIIDTCLVVLWFVFKIWRRTVWASRDTTYENIQLLNNGKTLGLSAESLAVYKTLPSHSKLLCQGFKHAQGNLPLMRLEFRDLSLTIPSKGDKPALTILKGVTGSIEPSKVTAIMGPSGAGKTTFLNTMLGKVDSSWRRGGSLKINGVDEPLGRFRKVIGFVPQEDIMHRDLSAYDNIRYSANMRLPREWTDRQREDHVNATISAMQLKHVQDILVGDEVKRGISGGQRKRCNIGMEVAAAPSLLLLDEPTSGLDSTAAMEICQVLKDLARVSGLTVAMVIHQPRIEIWHQLDELLLLAPGGLTVYQGPQRYAVQYFAERLNVHLQPNENPADALMDRIAENGLGFVQQWNMGGQEFLQQLRSRNSGSSSPQFITPIPRSEAINEEYEYDCDGSDYSNDGVNHTQSAATNQGGKNAKKNTRGSYGSHDSIDFSKEGLPARGAKLNGQLRIEIESSGSFDKNGPSSAIAFPRSIHAIANPPAFPEFEPLRRTAPFLTQAWRAFSRSMVKQLANLPSLALEIGLGMFAGGIMGGMLIINFQSILLPPYTLLSPSPNNRIIGVFIVNVGLAISLAAASAGVSVFGEELVIYRREIAAGHHHFAYYLGVNLAQFPRLFLDGLHFAFIFHLISQPLSSFGEILAFSFLLYSAIYGLAFIVSMVVARQNAPLMGVVFSLLFSNMVGKGGFPEFLQYLSASRWAAEGIFSIETEPFVHIMNVDSTAVDLGYTRDRFGVDMFLMFLVGLFYRLVAYACMRWVDRKL